MTIIFNELKYAKKLLKNYPKEVRKYDLMVLGSYFYSLGYTKNKAIEEKNQYCKSCDINYNFIVTRKDHKEFENKYGKRSLKIPKEIILTKREIETIKSQKDIKVQKILFVLLCLAKNNYKGNNRYFVNDLSFSQISQLAKVYVNKQSRIDLFYKIENDLINIYAESGDYELLFIENNSSVEIKFSDIDNMMLYFPIYCENCGERIEYKKGKRKIICEDCHKKKIREDTLNRVKKFRNK